MPILIESDKVCIDTNILIYSTFPDFDEEKHNNAMDALSQLTDAHNEFYITNQILREFFAISTNKKIFNVPLTPVNAVKKMIEFANCMSIIYELDSTIDTLTQLVLKYNVTRQKIHDFNIIAVMLDNKIEHILTYNVRDFSSVDEVNVIIVDSLE